MDATETGAGAGRASGRPGTNAAVRVLVGLGLAVLMVVGIVGVGRLAANDLQALALTSVFFLAVLIVIGVVGWRRREWFVPCAVPYLVVAMGATVILGRPLLFDEVVDEQVVVADATSGAVALAAGSFEPQTHPGSGTATLVRSNDGTLVLTLTDFETDNGPDVRVYLSRGTDVASGRGASFVDLGAMKGNKGDQQYAVPSDVDPASFDAVVLWCRAFDVGFTQAPFIAST